MKVIYVLPDPISGKYIDAELINAVASIVIGSIYTVIADDGKQYELAEFPAKKRNEVILWDKNCFVPLDGEKEYEEFVELNQLSNCI